MSVKLMTAAWNVELPISEKLVLLALADSANDEGFCWPSVTSLYKKCSAGERTVRRAIAKLVELGHLSVHERCGRSSYYTVHPCQSGTTVNQAPLPTRQDTPANAAGAHLPTRQDTPANAAPITIIEPSIEPSRNRQVGARAPRSPTATRLPEDFELTLERRAIAEAEKADPDREFANFTDHWRSCSGAKARKHDWDATWRIWCRRAADFKPRINGASAVPERTWRPPPDEADHAGK